MMVPPTYKNKVMEKPKLSDVPIPTTPMQYVQAIAELVSSPDLIRRVYHFQYNTRDSESDPHWGWFGVWD